MVEQYLVISWIIFSWLLLALQVKVGKVAHSWVNICGQTFNHKNHKYFAYEYYPLYGISFAKIIIYRLKVELYQSCMYFMLLSWILIHGFASMSVVANST